MDVKDLQVIGLIYARVDRSLQVIGLLYARIDRSPAATRWSADHQH